MARTGYGVVLGLAGLIWLYGCASPSGAQRDNIVHGGGQQANDAALPVADEDDAEVGGASEAPPSYCDGKPIEITEETWADGKLRIREEVVIDEDGSQIRHGLSSLYWPNGRKKLEMEYYCGVKHGVRVAWYEDGQQWSEGEYVYGKDHGKWTVWFPGGAKSQEFTMEHGAWHGPHTVWNAEGTKLLEETWVHGRRQGVLKIWDEEGNLADVDHYVDNIRQPMPTIRPETLSESAQAH